MKMKRSNKNTLSLILCMVLVVAMTLFTTGCNGNTTDKAAAEALMPKVYAMLDKLAKTNIIHKNKAANLKSGIAVYVNKLA